MKEQTIFEKLFKHYPEIVFVMDKKGRYVYVNEKAQNVLGYHQDDFTGKHYSEFHFLTEKSLQLLKEQYPMMQAGDIHMDMIITAISSNSNKHYYSFWFDTIIHDSKEYIWFVLKDVGNLMALRNEKKQLREQNFLLAEAVHQTGVGIIITDPNQHDNPIIFANKSFQEITGYRSEEIIGQNCRFLQGPETSEHTISSLREAVEKKKEIHCEILNYRKDGSTFWNELTISPVFSPNGELTHFIGIQVDITKRKMMELDISIDLSLARNLQQMLLSHPLTNNLIEIEGFYRPSNKLGGDYYKWHQINEDQYVVMIMDVMGHGIAPSLITMSINAEINFLLEQQIINPKEVLAKLNHHQISLFLEKNEEFGKFYFTCIYLLIDTKKRRIDYINAGHPDFYLKNEHTVKSFDSTSIPVGILKNYDFRMSTLYYQSNSELFLHTDGMNEILTENGSGFSAEFIERKNLDKIKKRLMLAEHEDDVCFIYVKLS